MLSRATARAAARFFCQQNANASTLIIGEHDGKAVTAGTLTAVTAASKFGGDVSVFLAGKGAADAAATTSKIKGVSSVLVADGDAASHGIAENIVPALVKAQEANKYTHIVACHTPFGKNVLPRLAALLDTQPISDVISIESEDTFVRPIYAGNALATVKSVEPVKVLTTRQTAFDKAETDGGSAKVETLAAPEDAGKCKWLSDEIEKSDRPDLTAARVVVSGGRALKSGENFKILYELADKLKGAVGASRAAVDAGYVSNDLQIGQTGKVVAPELYIAAGISGAIQHLAGMKDSKTIVCINKDPEAPLFQIADYGLVADLFTAVPELTQKI